VEPTSVNTASPSSSPMPHALSLSKSLLIGLSIPKSSARPSLCNYGILENCVSLPHSAESQLTLGRINLSAVALGYMLFENVLALTADPLVMGNRLFIQCYAKARAVWHVNPAIFYLDIL
jgi:hypothetical protein